MYHNGKVIAAYKDFEDTWKYDRANGTSNLLFHMSEAHLHPDGFEAMNVKRAFQMLSHTYACAIKLAGSDKNGLQSSTWEATVDFAEKVNRVIDTCNSYKLIFRNPQKRPLSPRNPEIEELLTEFIDWSLKWSTKPDGLQRAPCLKGFPLSVQAILGVYKSIAKEYPGFELAAGLCNQDSVEHLFSKLRQRGGHNPNPTARMVRLSIRHILSIGYIYGSDRANVQCDKALSLLNPITTEVSRAFEMVDEPELVEFQKDIEESSENSNVREALNTIESEVEIEDIEKNSMYELNAINYLAGYVAHKIIANSNCDLCRNVVLKIPMEDATENEIYTHAKEYKNQDEDAPSVSKLKRPTSLFEKIVGLQLRTFNDSWSYHWKSNMLQDIVREMRSVTNAVFPDWLDGTGSCKQYRFYALDFLTKVKLYSRTRCNNRATKAASRNNKSKNRKFKNITHQ